MIDRSLKYSSKVGKTNKSTAQNIDRNTGLFSIPGVTFEVLFPFCRSAASHPELYCLSLSQVGR